MQNSNHEVIPEAEAKNGIDKRHRPFARILYLQVSHFALFHENPDGGNREHTGHDKSTENSYQYPNPVKRYDMCGIRVAEKRHTICGHEKRVEYDAQYPGYYVYYLIQDGSFSFALPVHRACRGIWQLYAARYYIRALS